MRRIARKPIVLITVLLAFIAAALGPIIPRATAATVATPCAMMMTSSSMDGGQSSKGAMPVCGSDLSCIVAAALPAAFEPTVVALGWSPVRYWAVVNALVGIPLTPDISPPIARA